ncbi:GH36-type glycosyl hydrolase domain-containing protein [Pararhizobium mangrovi]|uniref:Protein ndvB n=1 Tax=Pararhizobium mangrovi TaxID=2590452 RepID=A0A506UEA0_9HYPH|nr:glucoamylase family protein [Pararhizobium mangrovi]TPW31948.1 protein ndvB [Pararhizobium mangrovi]
MLKAVDRAEDERSGEPLREAYLSAEDLARLGEHLAGQTRTTLPGGGTFDFTARQRDNERSIRRAYRASLAAVRAGEVITSAAEWLADNHYILEKNVRQVERDLPPRFFRELPSIAIDGGSVPRGLALAWLYVAHAHSSVSLETLTPLVEGYQRVRTLRIGELWALPSMLRFVLIENMRRISARVSQAREMRGRANALADRLLSLEEGESVVDVLEGYEDLTADDAFAAQLLYRLRDGGVRSGEAMNWLEASLAARDSGIEQVLFSEHNRLAEDNVTAGNTVTSLRLIDDIDWSEWFEDTSAVDAILRETPAFAALDFASRDRYRQTVEVLARRSGTSEIEVARTAKKLAEGGEPERGEGPCDIGFYLAGNRKPRLEARLGKGPAFKERVRRAYRRLDWLGVAVPILAFTAVFLVIVGGLLGAIGVAPLGIVLLLVFFVLPASEAASGLFNTLAGLFTAPSRLIGYEYLEGVPAESRTLVVVPCLISSRDGVAELLRNLEVHYLATTPGEVFFAILSDWPDSDVEENAKDAAVLTAAREGIAALNARYAADGQRRFFVFHRRRLHNPAEGKWMGWERKRGKLHELNRLLRGDPDTTIMADGQVPPADIRYVMTLDADTRLTRDAVTRLVGKMAHPTNAPVTIPGDGRVRAGYGILQPRVTASLTTGDEASAYQRIFSVNRGLDPYAFTVSDVYQDLLDEGSFTGKGLYHVDSFEAAIAGRIGENAVLSHDLLEGSLARCALASDVELVEDFPTRYEVEVSRQHRWTRGDWQLLPFVFSPKSPVSGLGRWKMIDNLRRSLTPIAWLAASVAGWCVLPAVPALVWQAILIFSLFVGQTLSLVVGALPRQADIVAGAHLHSVFSEINAANAQAALRIVFVSHSAYVMGDAICRALYRMFVSRRHLLEWRTAAQAQQGAHRLVRDYFANMWQAPLVALAALVVAALTGGTGIVVAVPFAVLWALAPIAAWSVSQPAEGEDAVHASEATREKLRRYARRTWRYFAVFANAENNHLPPDNMQEDPEERVAHRTSPTNIGLYLLSTVSARDFGWIGLSETVRRLSDTLDTCGRMQKHRGHLYNWYDTRTLEPLMPRYVSSVDSGNLAGHLVAVAAACDQWAQAPAAHLDVGVDGIADVAAILSETIEALSEDRRSFQSLHRRLSERVASFDRAIATMRREPEFTSIRSINLTVLAREIRQLAVNLDHEIDTDESHEIVEWANALFDTCEAYVGDSMIEPATIDALRTRFRDLQQRARALAFEMDFSFLYREHRRLLSIGYRVEDAEIDESCYDMLASEARLTSLFAIAKGDLPTEHWFRLGRSVVAVGTRAALLSWSGSMFEYLMPPLVMQERPGGILNQSGRLSIKRQITYAKGLGTPWGISESAFNARDHELNYQYSNFGVPSLGLKRGLGQNAVIAPYASLLACQYAPEEAAANLAHLETMGALGRYGFHDAIDFTPSRVPEGQRCAVVRNYMAHHHGMSITAVADLVFKGRLREHFHADPVIEAAELLLQEKAPREIPILTVHSEPEEIQPTEAEQLVGQELRVTSEPIAAERSTLLLSNSHYSAMMTATGAGYARWNGQAVTRWQPDPAEDRAGNFLFLRDVESGAWWSATAEPRSAPGETARTEFSDDKAVFHKVANGLRTELECFVTTEHDGEARRLTIHNDSEVERTVEVTSYMEVVVGPPEADTAHPAFAKMFVGTEIGPRGDVIHAWRRKRSADDPDMHVAHMVIDAVAPEGGRETTAETDRRRFIGRGRSLPDAAAFDPGATLSGTDGFTLDPIFSLRRVVRIPPGKKAGLVFWTLAAPDRATTERAIERYRYAGSYRDEAVHAWTRSQVQLRYLGISSQEAAVFQDLARYLLYPDLQLRAEEKIVRAGLAPQSALWPLSISGDCPIVLLRINDSVDMEIVERSLLAQEYLAERGLITDFVVLNEKPTSYVQELQQEIDAACDAAKARSRAHLSGRHIFALRRDLMDARTHGALLAAARVVLHTRNGQLAEQLVRAVALVERGTKAGRGLAPRKAAQPRRPALPSTARQGSTATSIPHDDLEFWNGYGGFADDGRRYVVRLAGGTFTPAPWINVVSNAAFGFHVCAEGGGFTWSGNSRDHQLTPWSNDPVTDRPGEAIHIVDRQTGALLPPCAGFAQKDDGIVYEASHARGATTFTSRHGDIAIALTQFVAPEDPVKISRLRLTNHGTRERRLRVYAYAEWVLGSRRAFAAPFVLPAMAEGEVMVAANRFDLANSERTAFLAASEPLSSFTSDRRSFIGRGDSRRPDAVLSGRALSNGVAVDGDPCAAIAVDVTIAAGQTREVRFVLGDGADEAQAVALANTHRAGDGEKALAAIDAHWRSFTDTLQVRTPDRALDHLLNGWLVYQNLSCRLLARTGFYQASGAYGFRDQLQDTLALTLHDPSLARRQILNAAGRQFVEGDVQHWWLPESGAGVRTRIADDVVWLAYAIAEYCEATGDRSILAERLPFLHGSALSEGENDAFFKPDTGEDAASVYEHAARALDLAVARTGPHGLPLFLGGDWNDGMNRVGIGGEGESVWLGWFLLHALTAFLPFAEAEADTERAARWQDHAAALRSALEADGWDGAWYRRGFFDDGTPLGASENDECAIDSIAQSWSVLSGGGDPERARTAMEAVLEHLVDDEHALVRLFTPPFSKGDTDPGYIRAYPPGVRENGGQYTHAATWVVYALAELGRGDDAYRCLSMLNPVAHASDRAAADRYRVEPYVVAADIYGDGAHSGRGGWTWYTGSAGWLYRAAVEGLLGIRLRGTRLVVRPALPTAWPGFEATLRHDGTAHRIVVTRNEDGSPAVSLDGVNVPAEGIDLTAMEPAENARAK